jgi:two-component system, cell cycle sensor histidine kinase and response regulator CckA
MTVVGAHPDHPAVDEDRTLRRAVDALSLAFVVVDARGHLQHVNRAAWDLMGVPEHRREEGGPFRFSSDEWTVHDELGDLVPLDHRPTIRALHGVAVRGEIVQLRKPGDAEPVWLLVDAAPLRAADGAIDGAVTTFVDVTERRLAEVRRRDAQRLETVGMLAGGIAHDFNNVLTAILGHADLARSDLGEAGLADDHPAVRSLEQVGTAATRAASMVRQLLAFSRRGEAVADPVSVSQVVVEMTSLLRRLLPADLRFEVDADPDAGEAAVTRARLEQVVLNLVANARDASPSGGTVRVEIRGATTLPAGTVIGPAADPPRHGWVALRVEDAGMGIAPELVPRVFDPFFTTKERDGTGIGLATVREIVLGADGSLTVETRPGRGTAITVLLPRVAVDGPRASDRAATTPDPRPSPRGHETVLLVDDDHGVRALARAILQAHGYFVLEASSGLDALRVAAGHPHAIDVLVADVVLPGLRGPQLAEWLRIERPDLAVLLLTGSESAPPQDARPDDDVLLKPFEPAALLTQVRAALDRAAR